MREANVFRKNRAFYSGVILTVVEGLLVHLYGSGRAV